MKVFDYGLKENWKAFKRFVESHESRSSLETYYFVLEEDDCGDEAVAFTTQGDLDEWLERTFWDRERYEISNLEDSMYDFHIWKLISESDFKRLETLCEGAKPTSIVIKGEKYFRKKISIDVEQTVIVSTNFY